VSLLAVAEFPCWIFKSVRDDAQKVRWVLADHFNGCSNSLAGYTFAELSFDDAFLAVQIHNLPGKHVLFILQNHFAADELTCL